MARDRIRDFSKSERLHNETRVQGSPGAGGRSRIGGTGRSGGVRGQEPGAFPLGTRIEHVTLTAVDGQTIAAGGGTVQWDQIGAAPTEIRGFASLLDEIGDNGAVGDIPVDVRGLAQVQPDLIFRGSVTMTPTVTVIRDGTELPDTFFEITTGWFNRTWSVWVKPGDTIRVSLTHSQTVTGFNDAATGFNADIPFNGEGSVEIVEGQVVIDIWAENSPTSDVPQPTVASVGEFETAFNGSGTTGATVTVPAEAEVGDTLVFVAMGNGGNGGNTNFPAGFTTLEEEVTTKVTSSAGRISVAVKDVEAAEPSSHTVTWVASGGGIRGVLVVLKNTASEDVTSAAVFASLTTSASLGPVTGSACVWAGISLDGGVPSLTSATDLGITPALSTGLNGAVWTTTDGDQRTLACASTGDLAGVVVGVA